MLSVLTLRCCVAHFAMNSVTHYIYVDGVFMGDACVLYFPISPCTLQLVRTEASDSAERRHRAGCLLLLSWCVNNANLHHFNTFSDVTIQKWPAVVDRQDLDCNNAGCNHTVHRGKQIHVYLAWSILCICDRGLRVLLSYQAGPPLMAPLFWTEVVKILRRAA